MNTEKYSCEKCIFYTIFKSRYNSHLLTKRHKLQIENSATFIHSCSICNKKFKTQSGIWSHRKKCFITKVEPVELINNEVIKNELINNELKNNQIKNNELKNILANMKNNYQQLCKYVEIHHADQCINGFE